MTAKSAHTRVVHSCGNGFVFLDDKSLDRRRDCGRSRVVAVPLVADAEEPLRINGPWLYKLADLYDGSAVTAVVENMTPEELSPFAACVYECHMD